MLLQTFCCLAVLIFLELEVKECTLQYPDEMSDFGLFAPIPSECKHLRNHCVSFCCTGQKQCPDGFQEHNQSCYKVVISHATWIHAREFCRAIGAHLVSINSVEEEHAVEATIASLNLGATALRSFWIGATDLSEKGIFVWMHDSSMVTYTNWQPGEPNNFGGKENCAEMFEDQLKIQWNDNNCSEKTDFICETSTS